MQRTSADAPGLHAAYSPAVATDDELLALAREHTGAHGVRLGERLQTLWSGYGEIRRLHLDGAAVPTIIAKRVQPPVTASPSTPAV